MMAGRGFVVQGPNDRHETSLTTAISNGEFKAAGHIIESTSDPTFLNDGNSGNFPLHMVLTNSKGANHCRNLKLARLLVEKGADSNLKVDVHWECRSPFEELVVYNQLLKSYVAGVSDSLFEELCIYFETDDLKLEFLTNTVDLDNTKCVPDLENCNKLVHQTNDLIDTFLEYGSDPSAVTNFKQKSLFHWVIQQGDFNLAKRLVDSSRFFLNTHDSHGTTPLMDCILRFNTDNALALYQAMRDTDSTGDLNTYNCSGETALFRAVFAGATEMADKLCRDGAQLKTVVTITVVPGLSFTGKEIFMFSQALCELSPMTTPFLAPFLGDSPVFIRYNHVCTQVYDTFDSQHHKHLVDKIISVSVSPLIDSGCFRDPYVASEVFSLLRLTNFDCLLMEEDVSPVDLMTVMFGQVSSSLRQLCVRTIFDQCLTVHQKPKTIWRRSDQNVFCDNSVDVSAVKNLMELLGLPQSFVELFAIEVAKYQLCNLIMSFRSWECHTCSISDRSVSESESVFAGDDGYDYSFDSSMHSSADSLYFFSSDISKESSKEFDDLSDEDISGCDEDGEDSSGEDEGENTSEKEAKEPEDGKHKEKKLKKINYEPGSSSTESDNTKVVVKVLWEDLAEGEAQDHPAVCCDKYQRLTDESTTSTPASEENMTPSGSISDSLC